MSVERVTRAITRRAADLLKFTVADVEWAQEV